MAAAPDDAGGWAAALATALVSSQPLPALVAQRLQQAFTPEAEPRTRALRCAPGAGGRRGARCAFTDRWTHSTRRHV